jgi:hypothetical protein
MVAQFVADTIPIFYKKLPFKGGKIKKHKKTFKQYWHVFCKIMINHYQNLMHNNLQRENWGFILVFCALMMVLLWISDFLV